MRIGNLRIKKRPSRLVKSQPFGLIFETYGWCVAFFFIAISWLDEKKLSEQLDHLFDGLE